jgi:diguanylate cyclase (GGDEF)-like protein
VTVPLATQERQWTLRQRFARLLVLAALIPAALFSAVMVWQQYRSDHDALRERLSLSTSLTSASIDDFIGSRLAGVTLLAQTRDAPLEAWSEDLVRLRAGYPALTTALVADHEGNVVTVAPSDVTQAATSRGVADRDYFSVPARTRRPYVSDAFRGRGLGNDPLVAISSPIIRDGRFLGIVEGSIHVDTFVRERGDAFHPRGYEMLLLDRRNQVIHASAGLPYKFLDTVADPRLTVADHALVNTAVTRSESDMLDGHGALVSRARMSSGWTLVLVAPEQRLLLTVGQNALVLYGLLILVGLGVLAATWSQMRALTQGTGHLLGTLRSFALGGQVDPESSRTMPMELKPVAAAIDDLSGRLNQAYGELNAALTSQRELARSLQHVVEERDQEIAARTAALRHAIAELERVARIDPLTSALNLRGFREEVGRLLEDPASAGVGIGALIVDVDHFKAYNDRYGHPAGDTVLKRIVGAMQTALRNPGDTLARVGGEEFAILLRDADEALIERVAVRIRDAVREADIPHADGEEGRVTISVGIAHRPSPEYMDPLLSQADEALYRAKRKGRDRVSR